jgi:hypothetical protein
MTVRHDIAGERLLLKYAAYRHEFKRAENASWDIVRDLGKKTTTADPLLAAHSGQS